MNNKNQNGFSLVELLAVVAIIGIIMAIAIPNLLASRRAANEGSATSSMRTIYSAERTYVATIGNGNYATLAELDTDDLIDSTLGSGRKSGYTFTATAATIDNTSDPKTFYAYSLPTFVAGPIQSGTRRFALSEDGIMRADTTLAAPANRAAIDGINPIGD
jgi:type IV pilus assembly protein PilA